jgi:hypothetical protein
MCIHVCHVALLCYLRVHYIVRSCPDSNLRDSQTSKIIIHSEKLVFDPKFSQDSRVKISNDFRKSRYEISVCETRKSFYKICLQDSREASLATKFLSARLVRSDSRCEISLRDSVLASLATKDSREVSLATNFDSRISRESRENFGSKKRQTVFQ